MSDPTGIQSAQATAEPIHSVGTAIFLSPEVFARAAEWGWANPITLYFAGRGGTLGDVGAPVVAAAMGYFNPEMLVPLYEEGAAIAGPRGAADRMMEAHALWGRDHLDGIDGLDELVPLADRLADGAEGAGLTLFEGWRAQPRADDAPARAAQLFQVLREWRGAAHLVATTAAGLSPLEAILTNEGPGQAQFFGWTEPFPDCSELRARHDEAEATTDRLCAREFERLFSGPERARFAALVTAVAAGATKK